MESPTDSKSKPSGESEPNKESGSPRPKDSPPQEKPLLKLKSSLDPISEEKVEASDTASASQDKALSSVTFPKRANDPLPEDAHDQSPTNLKKTGQSPEKVASEKMVKEQKPEKEVIESSPVKGLHSTPEGSRKESNSSSASSPDVSLHAQESACKFTKISATESLKITKATEAKKDSVAPAEAMQSPKERMKRKSSKGNDDLSEVKPEKEETESKVEASGIAIQGEIQDAEQQKLIVDQGTNPKRASETEKQTLVSQFPVDEPGSNKDGNLKENKGSAAVNIEEKSDQVRDFNKADHQERRDSINSGKGQRRTSNERNGRGRRRTYTNDREDSQKEGEKTDTESQRHHTGERPYNQRKRTFSNEKNGARTPRHRTKSKGNGQDQENGRHAGNVNNSSGRSITNDGEKEMRTSTPIPVDETETTCSTAEKGNISNGEKNLSNFDSQKDKTATDGKAIPFPIKDAGRDTPSPIKDAGRDTPSPIKDAGRDTPSPIKDAGRDTPSPIKDAGRDTPSPIKDAGRDTPSPIKDAGRDTPSPIKDAGRDTPSPIKDAGRDTPSPIKDAGRDTPSPIKDAGRDTPSPIKDAGRDTPSPIKDAGRDTPSPIKDAGRDTPSPIKDAGRDTPSPIKDAGRDTPSPIKDAGRDTPSPIKDAGRDTPSPIKDAGRDTPSPIKDAGRDTPSPIKDAGRDTPSPIKDAGRDTPSPSTDNEREMTSASDSRDNSHKFSPKHQRFGRNGRGSSMRYQRYNRRSWPQRDRAGTNEKRFTPQPNKSGHESSSQKENFGEQRTSSPHSNTSKKEEKKQELEQEANSQVKVQDPEKDGQGGPTSSESSKPLETQQRHGEATGHPQQQRSGGGKSYRQRRRSSTNERKSHQQKVDTSGESAPKDQNSATPKTSEASVTLESDTTVNEASKMEETSIERSNTEKEATGSIQPSEVGKKGNSRRRRSSTNEKMRDRSNTNEKKKRHIGKPWNNKKGKSGDKSEDLGEEASDKKAAEDKGVIEAQKQEEQDSAVKDEDAEKPRKKRRNSKKKAEKKEGNIVQDGNTEYGFVHRPPNPILLQVARNYGLTRRFVYPEQSKILVAGRGYFYCFNYELNKCCSQWISNCTWAIINLKSMSVQKRYKQGCQKCSSMVTPRFEQDAFVEMCHTVTKMYLSSILRGYIYKPRRKRLINESAHFKDMCERCKEINEACVQDVARQI